MSGNENLKNIEVPNEKQNINDNLKETEKKSNKDNSLTGGISTYYVPPIKAKEQTKIVPMTKKDTIFMILLFLISFLFVDFAFLNNFNLGFTITFFVLFIFTTAYFFKKEIKVSAFTYISGAFSLVSATAPALFQSHSIKAITVLLSLFLFTIYTCGISGTFKNKEGSFRIIVDMISGVLISPFINIVNVTKSFKSSLTKNKKSFDAIIGVIIAVPFLIVIIPLLVKSDAAFAGLIDKLVLSFRDTIMECFFVLVITPYLISYFYSKKAKYKVGSEQITSKKVNTKFLTNSISVSFLTVISITYLVYLFSQLAYFFSAFSGILPDGYEFSASVYARRGFYEMFVICLINIVVITVVNMFTKRIDQNKVSPVLKVLECFISLFSILLLIIAMSKMKLNIEHFGLSKARLVVALVECMLFVILVFLIVHIFLPKVNYMQPIIIICSVMFLAFSFVNVDAQIAKYNVEMYKKGELQTVDINYLNILSDSAIPYLVELTDDKNEDIAVYAKTVVRDKYEYSYRTYMTLNDNNEMEVDYKEDFRKYNYERKKACMYLAEYYNSLSKDEKMHFLDFGRSYYNPIVPPQYEYEFNDDNNYNYNYYNDSYEVLP